MSVSNGEPYEGIGPPVNWNHVSEPIFDHFA
jgi:hypothetical protein